MATDREYAILLNQYNIAIARIKEQDEHMAEKNKLWADYEKKCDVIEDHARKLCEMILAKDRDEMVLGNAKTWHDYSTDELIMKAEESFIKYIKENVAVKKRIMDVAEERGRKLESLQEQIAQMMVNGNVSGTATNVDEIIAAAEKTAAEKETKSKMSNKTKKAESSGNIQVIVEDESDMEESELNEINRLMNNAEQARLAHNAIPVGSSRKKRELIQKEKDKVVLSHMIDIQDIIKICDDIDWLVFSSIGEKGYSKYKDIEADITHESNKLKNSIRLSIQKLYNSKALEKLSVVTPLSGKNVCYKLSAIGQRMFKFHFNKEPCVSEIEKMIAEHDNPEHGYGIAETEVVLNESGRYTEVSSYNRDKAINVVLHGEKLKYVPDLVCVSKKGYTEYFEYERDNHNQANFNTKCDKMRKVTRFLNFVTPNKEAAKGIKNKVDIWIKNRSEEELKGVFVRIGTILSLKNENDWLVEYQLSKKKEPMKCEI